MLTAGVGGFRANFRKLIASGQESRCTDDDRSEKNIRLGGIDTAYLDKGNGPPLLLLHGFGPGGSALGNWSGVIEPLASSFRVIAPDLLGFGGTGTPEEPDELTFDRSARHIADLLRHLAIDRISIIGNNYGGALALKLAVARPASVSRMVLLAPPAIEFAIGPHLRQLWSYSASPNNMLKLMRSFVHDPNLISPEAAIQRHEETQQPGVMAAFSRLFAAPHRLKLRALATPHRDLAALPHSVLLLHAREDRIVPLGVSIRLSQILQGADLHVFGRCGNLIHAERRDEFLALAIEFLRND